jgi:protein-disulfide isomerase
VQSDLRSAPVPPASDADHFRGDGGPTLIVYADFECPYCAALSLRLAERRLPIVFRHFPVRSSHSHAWAAACASEAAGVQGAFWEMHDALFADQGRLDDPHLWDRARALGLDLERFDVDRRSDAVTARVGADFNSGIRAGVASTPTVIAADGQRLAGRIEPSQLDALAAG